MSEPLFAGIDLGTSACKGIVLDGTGVERAHSSCPYLTTRPEPGAAEQSPHDWEAALRKVLVELVSGAAPRQPAALGLTGMIPTMVTLGEGGDPLGPAVTWEDNRAEPVGAMLRETVGGSRCYEVTGQWLDGRYLLPMFLGRASADPRWAAAARNLCSAKDYLFFLLTGDLVTDPSTATGFGCFDIGEERYDDAILEAAASMVGGRLPELPEVQASTFTRPIRSALASDLGLDTLPVCLGGADSVVGALGLGASAPGSIAYLGGTSTVMLTFLDRALRDEAHRVLVTPSALDGRFGYETDLLSTGSALAWASRLTGRTLSESELVDRAVGIAPPVGPVFLPYLAPGEQGTLWDPSLEGTIIGLDLRDGVDELVRALLDGVVLESRRCAHVLGSLAGAPLELYAVGGASEHAGFRRMLADALGIPVLGVAHTPGGASARGAAMLAAANCGVRVPAPAPTDQHLPSDEGRQMWQELWVRHEDARQTVTSLYHRWSQTWTGNHA